MTFGLTPQGFVLKRLNDIITSMNESMQAEFGEVNLEPQSVFGQIIGVMSKVVADVWENLENTYLSQYPASAEGTSLDNVVQLNGLTRLAAQRSSVVAVAAGAEGTTITENSLARIPESQAVFFSLENTTISKSNAYSVTVSLDQVADHIYNMLISDFNYLYSLPTITFTGSFVTSNSTVITINGTQSSAVPFNSDNDTTLADIATEIQGFTEVLSAVATAPSTIDIIPAAGYSVTINSIQTTGGVSQPTSAITYRVPYAEVAFDADFVTSNSIVFTINGTALSAVPFNSDQATTASDIITALEAESYIDSVTYDSGSRTFFITANTGEDLIVNSVTVTGGASQATASILNPVMPKLAAIINAASAGYTATDNGFGTMEILADSVNSPFSATAGTDLTITALSTPVVFLAQEFGTIAVPANTLDEILTPIVGWDSINNPEAGVTGREVETDSELRLRRQNSIGVLGAATPEAIRARLLQEVDNVTSATIFENVTLQQEDLSIVLSEDLVTGNQIVPTVNGTAGSTVNFTSTHVNTMSLIATELETFTDLIDSVAVGGTGNRTLTVTFKFAVEVSITLDITGGASQSNVTYSGGRVPKSFEAVVVGGTDQDVGDKIWETKPAGIQTYGNTFVAVTDSAGDVQPIYFSRPTPKYIWVTVELTLYTEEDFPTNGTQLVQQAIFDYGSGLGIGIDVLLQRVNAQIFNVNGIASGDMELAVTDSTGDSPSFGTSDIPIGDVETSNWDLNRISVTVAP